MIARYPWSESPLTPLLPPPLPKKIIKKDKGTTEKEKSRKTQTQRQPLRHIRHRHRDRDSHSGT